jgi:tRNA threonylcarbamoyladenosine biosynthesis protein TsaE
MKTFLTHSRQETIELGKSFAQSLSPGSVVGLFGDLGSGKTHFVMGVCEALAVQGHVTSPTFTIINEYPASFGTVVHIDLYRIKSRVEIAELGLEEYFNTMCICLIEWAETALEFLPSHHHIVKMTLGSTDEEREITIQEVHGVVA